MVALIMTEPLRIYCTFESL